MTLVNLHFAGSRLYNPEKFETEAARVGVARRLPAFALKNLTFGETVLAVTRVFLAIYAPNEVASPVARPLSRWKETFGDSKSGGLRIPFGESAFTVGPELLRDLTDNTIVGLTFQQDVIDPRSSRK